jgi:hypothetical protein
MVTIGLEFPLRTAKPILYHTPAEKFHRHQTLKKTHVLNILHGRPHGQSGIINQDINPGKFPNSVLNQGRTRLWIRTSVGITSTNLPGFHG